MQKLIPPCQVSNVGCFPSGSSGLRLTGGKLNSAPLPRVGFFRCLSTRLQQPFEQSGPLTMKPHTPLVAKKRMALSRLLSSVTIIYNTKSEAEVKTSHVMPSLFTGRHSTEHWMQNSTFLKCRSFRLPVESLWLYDMSVLATSPTSSRQELIQHFQHASKFDAY
jgi:hypothetical protein